MMLRKRLNFAPPQWLGEEVADHLVGRAMLNGNVVTLLNVGNKEIPDVHVSCSLAARGPSVGLKQLGAGIILMQFCWLEWISLRR